MGQLDGVAVMGGWWRPFLATAAGVILAIILDRLTDYFTGTHGAPVQEIKGFDEWRPSHHDPGWPGRWL